MADEQKRVCIGRIGAAHGTRGEVRLWSFTADPPAIAQFSSLESEDGRVFEIAALRPGKGFFVARLKDIADRTAAERLNNVDLFVPRERLPALDAADEYYHADLIGLAVVDAEGTALGRVVAIQNFGAGDLIEVAPAAGGDTVFLPFSEVVAPVVDIAGGRIVVNPPEEIFSEDRDVPPPSAAPTRSTPKARPR
jgi:16S rRNA processing protein RimM